MAMSLFASVFWGVLLAIITFFLILIILGFLGFNALSGKVQPFLTQARSAFQSPAAM